MEFDFEEHRGKIFFVLGLAITTLWVVFCINSGLDNTGKLVLSNFFLGKAMPLWLFIAVGVIVVLAITGLFGTFLFDLETERDYASYGSDERKKLGTRNVIIGLVVGVLIIIAILALLAIVFSGTSAPGNPSRYYYYYYY
jgi:hypothetical protein